MFLVFAELFEGKSHKAERGEGSLIVPKKVERGIPSALEWFFMLDALKMKY